MFDDVLALPGVGQSTAGAILAQAEGQRHAILDGNVKRVWPGFMASMAGPDKPKCRQILWQKAEQHTPDKRLADYTQA